MKSRPVLILALLTLPFFTTKQGPSQETPVAGQSPVLVARLEEKTISPGTAWYLERVLREAKQQDAECLVVVLDTPGGLLTSTRKIVKRFLGSETPVIVYVAPAGSRAASAGVFITMSAHLAAMAPGTNIGAAHPVQIGGMPVGPDRPTSGKQGKEQEQTKSPREQKIVNDTVAWARSLAQQRDRNAEWVAKAVKESISVSASEAVEENVVDLMAEDLEALLAKADGQTVELPAGSVTLHTADATTREVSMWWGEELLAIISHPNVAFLLLMFGFYGVLFELYNPGWGVPGTLGLICLLLGLFGLSVLPVNYLGFALILVAFGLFIAETFVTSYGALAIAGTACLILGGVMLVDSPEGFTEISWSVLLPIAAATLVVVSLLMTNVIHTHRRTIQTGGEGLIGAAAEAVQDFSSRDGQYAGTVKLHGERWRALSDQPLAAGQPCRVTQREGLSLIVAPQEEHPVRPSQEKRSS